MGIRGEMRQRDTKIKTKKWVNDEMGRMAIESALPSKRLEILGVRKARIYCADSPYLVESRVHLGQPIFGRLVRFLDRLAVDLIRQRAILREKHVALGVGGQDGVLRACNKHIQRQSGRK